MNDALFTNNRTERSNKIKCHYCKKKGHIARDCYKKKRDDAEKEKGNLANQYKENEYNVTLPETALKLSRDIDKSDWWIDSGASQHMTHEKSNLLNYEAFKSPIEIKLADDSIVLSYGKGDVKLAISDDGDNKIIILKDVLYVPNIQNNLFSLPAITDKGISVSFNKNACEIIIDGKKVVIGHKYGKLFKLDVLLNYNLCQLTKSDTNQNYGIYGHLGYKNLKMLKLKNMVNGMNVDVNKLPHCCEECTLEKQH